VEPSIDFKARRRDVGRLPSSLTRIESDESNENAEKISNALWKKAGLWKNTHRDIPIRRESVQRQLKQSSVRAHGLLESPSKMSIGRNIRFGELLSEAPESLTLVGRAYF
jgi:hypothetical protein